MKRTLTFGLLLLLTLLQIAATPTKPVQLSIRRACAKHLGNQLFLGDKQITFGVPFADNAGYMKLVPSSNKQYYLAEFREFRDEPDSGTIGLYDCKTGQFRYIAGYKVANATKDDMCRGAVEAKWLDKSSFRVKIISHTWRQAPKESYVTTWKTFTVKTKGYCPPEQVVAEAIYRLILTDKQLKGMQVLFCCLDDTYKEHQVEAHVGKSCEKFPQWIIKYKVSGTKFISKQLIYGE